MLERLYASIARGPSLNCRPHSSRQRLDVAELVALGDEGAAHVLEALLGESGELKLRAQVTLPPALLERERSWRKPKADVVAEATPLTAEQRAALDAFRAQKSLLTKLRNLGDDARTYEQDTGVHALALGFPLLSLPPGAAGGTRRILAPVAFVPLVLEVTSGHRAQVTLRCHGEGVDRVVPNRALLAWIERETGKPFEELFDDEEGGDPGREVAELVAAMAERLELGGDDVVFGRAISANIAVELPDGDDSTVAAPALPIPRADALPPEASFLPSAVIGLFPSSNQGLLRDTKEMIAAPELEGPVVPFLDLSTDLAPPPEPAAPDVEPSEREFATERFIARADPFQARAVALARSSRSLVVHGPPGTGKSQTITNIIGDHLARGERVLFVCDKRTAIDVVADRLDHVGLGRFCAVVHDARRDQRDLYMGVRGALEELTEIETDDHAAKRLGKVDDELARIHGELRGAHAALMEEADGASFHDLMGRWLALPEITVDGMPSTVGATMAEVEERRRDLEVMLERAQSIRYPIHPWNTAAGGTLGAFLGQSMAEARRLFASVLEDGRVVDRHRDEAIPPFDPEEALDVQAARRTELARRLRDDLPTIPETVRTRVATFEPPRVRRFVAALEQIAPHRVRLEPLDRELTLALGGAVRPLGEINRDIAALDRYVEVSGKWWGFLGFGAKSAARKALAPYGLAVTPDAAKRAAEFLRGLASRVVASDALRHMRGEEDQLATPIGDEELRRDLDGMEKALAIREPAIEDASLDARMREALFENERAAVLQRGLEASAPRADALQKLNGTMQSVPFLASAWADALDKHLRAGQPAQETLQALEDSFDDIETVLRVRESAVALPAGLGEAAQALLRAELGRDDGLVALERRLVGAEIARRMQTETALQKLDGAALAHAMERYRELEAEKRALVQATILHDWVERQRAALLAGTRSRLNSDGAALRRRLFVRGRRAMRLRQVIANGEEQYAGDDEVDPLFTMCPVWMASPEAVAQVFSRKPLFDVVIFDEASQCRLEEALPVLTRAKRSVIAGDPKQLPPTRFFEAAVATSEDAELETDQDLFEAQQSEVEDLLAGALNLEVDEAYLDVHYRSRNADLIGFSNEHFYRDRLQAIPGHPRNRVTTPPLRLVRVEGLYRDRRNRLEADRVVDLVAELLDREEPPSIGIACFNLTQRDLIREVLDERAEEDGAFGAKLARARSRRGEGSFEGLFVKNLENVQGDERDHIIISTTYGPNEEGKFYRRFGPLGRAGGGRRLNVLVTRAREEVHLVSSIPRAAYASVDTIPEGQNPNGGWLLFAYLRYAELLERLYDEAAETDRAARETSGARHAMLEIPPVSQFGFELGARVVQAHALPVDTHWGNEGFCVDVALRDKAAIENATVGVLCDFTRYPRAPDPIEWEIFRSEILAATGWELHRVWTPDYFRDPERVVRAIAAAAEAVLAKRGSA